MAAICYRMHGGEIEFLLVRTRGGRWIFPKGSAEAGLTHAEAAALEAFEEAGVHGRMQVEPFTHYLHQRSDKRRSAEISTSAHLCEVTRLSRPTESYRQPAWFSPDQARKRLRENRNSLCGRELARVVDRAVAQIRRQGTVPCKPLEELSKIVFEAATAIDGGAHPVRPSPFRRKLLLTAGTNLGRSGLGDILEFRQQDLKTDSGPGGDPAGPLSLNSGKRQKNR